MNNPNVGIQPVKSDRLLSRLPPFERFPFRAPEMAKYRTGASPRGAGNPAYEACPGPRPQEEVYALITKDNPIYDPAIRSKSAETRREHLDDVLHVFFPMRRQISMENLLNATIRNSYVGRNPAQLDYMDGAMTAANGLNGFSCSGTGPVGSGCITGPKGNGKSETIKRLLRHGFPQVALHDRYKGQVLGFQQLVWLYLSCPPKASVSALFEWIGAVIDHIFKTDILEQVVRQKNDSGRGRIVARALSQLMTGVVVLDELQNIKASSIQERAIFTNFLQELINTTRTRFILIGTPELRQLIRSEAVLRRLDGERGELTWESFDFEEWQEYLPYLLQWRVTKDDSLLVSEVSETMYNLTGGIPSHATFLWIKAQDFLIGNPHYPEERITKELLVYTMAKHFPGTHQTVQAALRRRNAKARTMRRPANPGLPPRTTDRAPDQANATPIELAASEPVSVLPDGDEGPGYEVNSIIPSS